MPFRPALPRRAAFTLIELLCVVAIMTAVGVVAVPAMSFVGAARFSRTAVQATQLLEEARAYAIANNTYTWVAFHAEPASASAPATVYAAVVGSVDGTSELVAGTSFGSHAAWPQGISAAPAGGNANCQLIRKVRAFPYVGFADAGAYAFAGLPAVDPVGSAASGAPTFSLVIPGLGAQNFDRAIQFTPSGEAKVQAAVISPIEFGLYPVNGALKPAAMAAVMRINGYTGQARVYLP